LKYILRFFVSVKRIVEEDARYTIEEISDISGLNSSSVFLILKEKLKLRKVCARWIPHLLTNEQKRQRVKIASELLSRFKDKEERRLREIVTGDETWLYFFEPSNKENNKMWIGEVDERPKIARRSRTVRRVMYALFFDSDGRVARIPVPEHTSVTGTFYKNNVLSAVVRHYTAKRPRTGLTWGQVTTRQRTSPSFCRCNGLFAGEQHRNFTALSI